MSTSSDPDASTGWKYFDEIVGLIRIWSLNWLIYSLPNVSYMEKLKAVPGMNCDRIDRAWVPPITVP